MRFGSALVLMLAVTLLAGCGDSPDDPGTPEERKAPASVSEWDLKYTDLDAADASTAFAVGAVEGRDASLIMKTTDGGATWASVLRLEDAEIVGVDFVDAQNGAAITSGGAVIVTADGGANWGLVSGEPLAAKLQSTDVIVNHVAVLGTNAWAAGSREDDEGNTRPAIFVSKDSGGSWSESKLDAKLPAVALNRVVFADAQNGWACGGEPDDASPELLIATTDGGATWKSVAIKTAQSPTSLVVLPSGSGWMAGMTIDEATLDPGPSAIFQTTDGGKTWSSQKKVPVSLQVIRFADEMRGWTAGSSSKIFGTTDGGKTWNEQTAQDRSSGQVLKKVEPQGSSAAEAPTFYGIVMLSPTQGLAPSDRGIYAVTVK